MRHQGLELRYPRRVGVPNVVFISSKEVMESYLFVVFLYVENKVVYWKIKLYTEK